MTLPIPQTPTQAPPARLRSFGLAITLGLLLASPTLAAPAGDARRDADDGKVPRQQTVAGYLENVRIMGTDLVFKARLDSGATLSSLNALDQERFERDGKDWVRFKVLDPADDKKRIELEYPVVREIRIVQHSGNHQERPVIELELCVGQHQRRAQVTLADRSEFTYQLLVGRNHMRDALLIDPGKRHLHEPACGDSADAT